MLYYQDEKKAMESQFDYTGIGFAKQMMSALSLLAHIFEVVKNCPRVLRKGLEDKVFVQNGSNGVLIYFVACSI